MRCINLSTEAEIKRFGWFFGDINQVFARSKWSHIAVTASLVSVSSMSATPKAVQAQMIRTNPHFLNVLAFEPIYQKDVNSFKVSFRTRSPIPFVGRAQADQGKCLGTQIMRGFSHA